MVTAVAVTEPGYGSDVSGITSRAVLDGSEWVISGTKKYISNAAQADWICTLVRTEDVPGSMGKFTQILVPTSTPGFTVKRNLDKLGGRAVDNNEIVFNECRVPIENTVGHIGRGFPQQMSSFETERMMATYIAIGEMNSALEQTRAWVDTRRVFGRPLVESQHVQFTLVELRAQLDIIQTYTYSFVEARLEGRDTRQIAATAKLIAARLARQIADACLQLHGGSATWMTNGRPGISATADCCRLRVVQMR
jgi:citronellyl-CoA dehydrogenase